MNAADLPSSSCSGLPAGERCTAELPDSPQCAPNYHFGMLLGVEDFRAEQGFHVGRLRRHQRLLHGAGVVAGFAIDYDATDFELRVDAGYAIDILGRDLWLDSARCVNLALWWAKHRNDEDFEDIVPGEDAFDLDIVACYANCLDRPVPAIAEPCAGDASDIAHSRICETVTLGLRRHVAAETPAQPGSHHLLRMWLGLEAAARDPEGNPLPDDQWLIDRFATIQALPADQQEAARRTLLAQLIARATAATSPFAPDLGADQLGANDSAACLTLARLSGVRVSADGENWKVAIDAVDFAPRTNLLPTSLLQDLLLAEPPPAPAAAGPVLLVDGASVAGNTLTLVFNQTLAAASVASAAFAVSEFDSTLGWQAFTPGAASYDESDPEAPTVTLPLDRAPSGQRLRITVIGTGNAPLLGKNLIPAGALHPDSDGRNLTTTLSI